MPATFATETTREGLFASTRWTMVLDAGESQTPPDQALNALSELCRIYWRPIFLFLRRQGSNPARCARSDARLFRAFDRVTCLRPGRSREGTLPFLSTRRTQTFRGPRARTRSDAEARRRHDPGAARHGRDRRGRCTSRELAAWSAERVYEREWAETLLRQALDRLAEECALAGKDELFKQLNSHLSVSSEAAVPYEEISLRLGRPITTLRSDVARLRSRYRVILREEVGGTVAKAFEVDAELRHLCEVLAAD
jgi:hypothetical protein